MRPRLLLPGLLLVAAACGGGTAAGDLAVTVDSTADSILVTISGDIPAGRVRHLEPEVQIAPGIDDTTLFTSVWEFDVDRAGRFWVFDNGSRSIFQFAPDGSLIRRIGRDGAGPGEFRQNGGMVTLADDGLAQWDSRNARVSRFDSAGTFIGSMPVPGGFSTSNGLYVDDSGQLYLRRPVTDPREGEILGRMGLVALGPDGEFADSLVPPDLDVPREVYVAQQEGGRSSMSSPYAPNYHWAWLPSGEFVVADGGRFEIIVARRGGKPVVMHRSLAEVSMDPRELSELEATIRYAMRQTEPGWDWRGPPLSTTKAPLLGLATDRDGRLWARVAVASERIPEGELLEPQDSLEPVSHFRMPSVYEVFSRDGRFLARVVMPPRTQFVDASGNEVWGLARSAEDLPAISRFRITPALTGGDAPATAPLGG